MTDLITKYRPNAFDQVLGQDPVVRALETSVQTNNASCFLFVGPSGVGKTTLARILAKALGCTEGGIVEVDAATFSTKEDMGTLTKSAGHRPILSISPKRAFIVDECHALSTAAIESLLKALEEPAPWQYWMLCTTEGGRIRPTIRTRAMVCNLRPVQRRELAALLDYIVEKEKMSVPTEVVDLCVAQAAGSPRNAITNLVVCASAKDKAEASLLLSSALESAEAGDLALALAQGGQWSRLIEIVQRLVGTHPESIRQVVRAFFTNGILKTGRFDERAGAILDAFSGGPWSDADGITPVLLAIMRLEMDRRPDA